MAGSGSPIIVVRRRKRGHDAHHGGSWKVAYADFVTAMMAFFLVLWLITALDKDQRAALFDYFKNPSLQDGKSTRAAPAQMGPGGASTSPINLGGGLDAPRTAMTKKVAVVETSKLMDEDQAAELAAQADQRKLESLMAQLREAIDHSQALKPFKDQLLLDITPEGLRIQIVDEQNRPMFDVGSAHLEDYTEVILHTLAGYLNTVPNRISLTGHTDTRPYPGKGYSNWELSADRANAARRALEEGGLQPEKISRVVGLSSSVLFDKTDPMDPVNRRISIIVLTRKAEDEARATDERPEMKPDPAPLPAPTRAAAAPTPTPAAVSVQAVAAAVSKAAGPVAPAGTATASAAPAAAMPGAVTARAGTP